MTQVGTHQWLRMASSTAVSSLSQCFSRKGKQLRSSLINNQSKIKIKLMEQLFARVTLETKAGKPLLVLPLKFKGRPFLLHIYQNHLLADFSEELFKCDLSFDLSFCLLRSKSIFIPHIKKQIGVAEGVRFEKDSKNVEFQGATKDINALRDSLKLKINQQGFHELIKPIKKLGKGNFGTVYLVQSLQDGKIYAAKSFLKYSTFGNQNGKQSLINQINIMRQLAHRNLMTVYEVYETQNSIYVIVEQLKGGSLGDIFVTLKTFPEAEVKVILKGILEGLAYMHSKRIMHRDLKPDNIMFRGEDCVEAVIADFGLATNCDLDQYLFSRCGTPGYVAPEVINITELKSKYEPECDIYSIGCIFFQILTGRRLFDGKVQADIMRLNKAAYVDFKMSYFEEMQPKALNLIKRMLEKDPAKRIKAREALMDPYFNDPIIKSIKRLTIVRPPPVVESDQQKKSEQSSKKSIDNKSQKNKPKDKLDDSMGALVVRNAQRKRSKLYNEVKIAAASFAARLKQQNQKKREEKEKQKEKKEEKYDDILTIPFQPKIQVDQSKDIRKNIRKPRANMATKSSHKVTISEQEPAEKNPEQKVQVKKQGEQNRIRLVLKSSHQNIVVQCEDEAEYEIVIICKKKIKAHVL